jgi:uncharacterized protein (DUF433 family)
MLLAPPCPTGVHPDQLPPVSIAFDTARPDDPYIRVKDVVKFHRAHPPARAFLDPTTFDCQGADCCLVIPSGGVSSYLIDEPVGCVSYRALIEAFQAERLDKARRGKRLRRAPFLAWEVFAPLKLLLADRDRPLRTSATIEPVYPLRAKMGVYRATVPPIWVYVALGVINSAYGNAYYGEDLLQRTGVSHAIDGTNEKALEEIPLAHRDAERRFITAAADLAYQLMTLREAQRALSIDVTRQLESIAIRLSGIIAIDLLKLEDAKADELRRSVRHLNLVDAPQQVQLTLFHSADELPTIPPVRLSTTDGTELPKLHRWEERINSLLSDQVGNAWLWTNSKDYIRFLNGPHPAWDSQDLEEGNLMSRAELAIVHEPRRCAGRPTVGATRITVHGIISRLKMYDWNKERVLELGEVIATPEQVDSAIAYYRENTDEIERILEKQRQDYERLPNKKAFKFAPQDMTYLVATSKGNSSCIRMTQSIWSSAGKTTTSSSRRTTTTLGLYMSRYRHKKRCTLAFSSSRRCAYLGGFVR